MFAWTLAAAALATVAITAPANAGLIGQLGILDLDANGGINPATGQSWALGDQYRLIFITSEESIAYFGSEWNDISTWNDAVQNIANNAAAHDLSSVTWNIVGSTAAVDARDNTSTNPFVDGPGHAIMGMDGQTVVANNFNDLWSGQLPIGYPFWNENGVADAVDWPLTGTALDGTADGGNVLQDGGPIRAGRNQPGHYWINANATGANWLGVAPNTAAVYGMSEALMVIPEPSSALLALLGLVGLLMVRRKR